MSRRQLVILAIVGAVALVTLYVSMRFMSTLEVRQDLRARAEVVARHREAQRAQPVSPAPATAPAPEAAKDTTTADAASAPVAAAPYWTDFRGPQRDGHYRERPIRTNWDAVRPEPLWKQPLGAGHASFVAARGRAFTSEQRAGQEVVAAYDIASGRELWTHGWDALFSETYGGAGPRATPTWNDGRVYALGAAGELRVVDEATGRLVWRTNILDDADASNLQWGMAASPLVVGSHVIVLPGGSGGQAIVAYDKVSGRRAWSALDDAAGYSSAMLVTLAGVEQIVAFMATRVVGVAPTDGRLLWEFPWATQSGINVAQPLVVGGNRVFISSGYGMGAAMIEVTRDGDRLAPREVWRTSRMKNQFTSSVYQDGFIYGLDQAILACLDASSGEVKWKGGRYGSGQVLLAGGHLIVTTDQGELALVRATPERHVEIARFPALQGLTWSHPAMADGYLLVRNVNEMAAFDLRR